MQSPNRVFTTLDSESFLAGRNIVILGLGLAANPPSGQAIRAEAFARYER
jgi:hypothetical protein